MRKYPEFQNRILGEIMLTAATLNFCRPASFSSAACELGGVLATISHDTPADLKISARLPARFSPSNLSLRISSLAAVPSMRTLWGSSSFDYGKKG
jgi:hypothetical protein